MTANLVALPVTQTNVTRVAILPIRRTVHGEATDANTGLFLDSDVSAMREQTDATRRGFVEPFSYGLTTWSIDVLPTVENTTLFRGAAPTDSPTTDQLLKDANLQSLQQSYDIIIFFYSKFTAAGSIVANDPCCFWLNWIAGPTTFYIWITYVSGPTTFRIDVQVD